MVALGLLLLSCSGVQPLDVTPVVSESGAVNPQIRRVAPDRFEGEPLHIGFEPLPFEGGDFPALMDFALLPGSSDELLAVNRAGTVGHFRLEVDRATLLGSFQIPAVYTGDECGAAAIEVDPDFSKNKLFYVAYCIDAQYAVVKRYTMSEARFSDTLFTAANVLAVGDAAADRGVRAVGSLAFGPDGALWATMGDHGRDRNAQDLTNELGAVIRFVPLKRSSVSGYEVPSDNAFPNQAPRSPLIYAYGVRDARSIAFDAFGRLWFADGGAEQFEEVNVVTAVGQNFGWPDAEGVRCALDDCTAITAPVRTWDHASDHPFVQDDPLAKDVSSQRAAWVGMEYRPGETDPYKGLLTGKMLYGDRTVGYVRAVALDEAGRVISDQYVGHLALPVSWQQGRDGYVYVGTMHIPGDDTPDALQGQLWRVVPLP